MQQSSSNILSIIIVSYNTKQLLKECLNSINDQNHNKEVEIIVVDNASSDETVKMVKEYFPEIKLIENDKNMGFGVANNQGAAIARGEYLLLINSDTALEKNALNKMIAAAEKYEDAGAIGFKIMNSDRSLQSSCGNFPTLWNIIAEALFLDRIFKPKSSYHILNEKKYQNKFNPDWVSGSCFMIKKKVFDKVSGFDEKFFLYVEEVDLCYRIKQEGYKNYYFPIDTVIHYKHGGSSNKAPAIIFGYNNILLFFKKHYFFGKFIQLYFFIMLKSIFYFFFGIIIGSISKKYYIQAINYGFLFLTLISRNKLKKYENSFKQQD